MTTMTRLAIRFVSLLGVLAVPAAPVTAQMMGSGGGPMGSGGGQAVRGTVTSASADNIAIKGDDGASYKVIVTVNTRIMQQREPVKAADIKPGEYVVAMGQADEATKEVHAGIVMVMSAEQAEQMKARAAELQASLGKTWIMGKITAMDETKLTIERPDKMSQVIEVDENTSMHRGGRGAMMGGMGMGPSGIGTGSGRGMGNGSGDGPRTRRNQDGQSQQGPPPEGEAITLADIKVGDNIRAEGALKGNTFVPKTLNVLPQRGQRGPRPGGEQSQPPQQ
ncbi:hypothetical protein FTW19_05970 [Terriglobus albidus]|uniref:Uncharacterized protein n=1 Tax=Terriglobus albidus TaxID=1592106 RepID=A0A5B9E6E9_9BACT|nr:DUF5666 domain-containing protein [Terriglobus albidus]QEE27588.1 hypothetical protein FTW19_05970 [Terriglobus albidus]